jgi:ring-1,2-phenylacetyl-CoA epoxidase subunit PaaD
VNDAVVTSLPPEAAAQARIAAAWAVLHTVLDPEVPVLSVCDLGIVRAVQLNDGGLQVTLTPTYSGCPATEVIESSVRAALQAAGLGPVHIHPQRVPAWTSDWITPEAREKLRAYGIAPPCQTAADEGTEGVYQPLRFMPQPLACPRCGSRQTERLSAFGSTACKALHRCLACREPFEHFKPI